MQTGAQAAPVCASSRWCPVDQHQGLETKKPGLMAWFLLENGSLGRARTADPVINSHLLYQLSYQGS